jgi:Protein of unknown function (DUF3311)/REV protein (anti-repression trans-activator protein)
VADERAGRAPTPPRGRYDGYPWMRATAGPGMPGYRQRPPRPPLASAWPPRRPGPSWGPPAPARPQAERIRQHGPPPRGAGSAGQDRPGRRRRRRRWLLLIPLTAPLLSPLTNSYQPELWGIPFFYWYQLFCGLLAIVVITTVFLSERERR